MSEPTMQVPVSLVERIAEHADSPYGIPVAWVRELRSLLSQPTPTAEPTQTCGVCGRQYSSADARSTCPLCWPGFGEDAA